MNLRLRENAKTISGEAGENEAEATWQNIFDSLIMSSTWIPMDFNRIRFPFHRPKWSKKGQAVRMLRAFSLGWSWNSRDAVRSRSRHRGLGRVVSFLVASKLPTSTSSHILSSFYHILHNILPTLIMGCQFGHVRCVSEATYSSAPRDTEVPWLHQSSCRKNLTSSPVGPAGRSSRSDSRRGTPKKWSFYGHFMFILWLLYGHFMVILYYSMVILCYVCKTLMAYWWPIACTVDWIWWSIWIISWSYISLYIKYWLPMRFYEMMIDLNPFWSFLCADLELWLCCSTGDEWQMLGPQAAISCMADMPTCQLWGRRLQLFPRQLVEEKRMDKIWDLLITCWIFAESWTLPTRSEQVEFWITQRADTIHFSAALRSFKGADVHLLLVKLAWSHSFRLRFGWWLKDG